MKTAAIDFETYYDDTYGITIQGTRNYIFDSRFDAYMVTIKTDTGIEYAGPPAHFDWSQISGEGWQWLHHNASFDELIMKRLRESHIIPETAVPEVTHCTADLCAYLGGPRNLAGASKFFLNEEVSKETRTAMKGQKWESMTKEFREEVTRYAMRDSELTLDLWLKLSDQWPDNERLLSRHTRMIAWDGVPIDVEELDKAIPELARRNWEAGTQLPWYHEGEEKPLSPKALAEQCRKVGIEPPPSLAKDSADCAAWEDKYGDTYSWVAAMREYRRTNTLLERLKAMRARVTSTKDMNFGLLYFGASVTGRWSGADGVNVQNLPSKPMFGVDFRSLLKAPPGYKFINADLSQIEPRCLAWLAGNEPLLQKLRDGMAIYEAHARTSMGWTGGKLKNEDAHLYALAKARVLSLGYGAGADQFVDMAANYGIKLTLSEADSVVQSFRASEPLICGRSGLWNQLQQGMTSAAAKREDYQIEIPSGRILRFLRPSRLGGLTAETVTGRGVTRSRWWGGRIVQNVCQATARDIFASFIPVIEYELGLPILFHVHDELTCLVKEDKAEDALRDILQVMRTPPPFMPDLPLDAEGKIVETYPNK
jgi:DNA polymerase I-like protein with 3'-5' exonuclease and polymerase domains